MWLIVKNVRVMMSMFVRNVKILILLRLVNVLSVENSVIIALMKIPVPLVLETEKELTVNVLMDTNLKL